MFTPSISEADYQEAKYERKHNESALIRERMLVLCLTYQGWSRKACAETLDMSRNTVTNYIKLYEEGGMKGLEQLRWHQPLSQLAPFEEELREHFSKHPPYTVNEAISVIEQLTQVRLGKTQVHEWLKQGGFKRRKLNTFPGGKDPEELQRQQQAFLENTLEPTLAACQEEECHLLFLDAAHFVLGSFVTYVWCLVRCFLRSSPGRYRLNVLGVVHAATNEILTMYNDTYINAQVVAQMLKWVAQRFADKPIYIVLDNARYQHCTLIKELAAELKITLLYLPPYSPNLNVIERLWKYLKKEICYGKYYPSKEAFHQAIINGLKSLGQQPHRDKLWTLLNPVFQRFDNAQILTG